jgi:hypothetical protein
MLRANILYGSVCQAVITHAMSEFFCELMTESLLREESPAGVLESRCGGQSTQSLRFLQAQKRHVPELLARACLTQLVQRVGQSFCKLALFPLLYKGYHEPATRPSMIFRRESRHAVVLALRQD